MENYEGEKYYTDSEHLKQTLEQYGVAIIPELVDKNTCKKMEELIWKHFSYITQNWTNPIRQDNSNSWKGIFELFPSHSMLIQFHGVGHCEMNWEMRQDPRIVQIFAELYGCSPRDLLVSFDGLSFGLPPETTQRGWNRHKTWFHTDQAPVRNDFECVQSWITARPVNRGDATLSVLESIHKYHADFEKEFQTKHKKDWYKLNPRQQEFFIKKKGCNIKNIMCPAGSLVLWDSRTIHCGIEAMRERQHPNTRIISYLCYQPRSQATSAQIKKKQKAFNERRATTHWPCKVKLFGKQPQTYGKPLPEITIPEYNSIQLTDLGRRLAGFEE